MTKPPVTKILIANRGEIACRIILTAHNMGIKTVAIASDPDKTSLHTKMADEVVWIGGGGAVESYLDNDKVLQAAKQTNADAIHPGYGFLSENATFAKKCEEAGIVFIGPSAETIQKMGLKDTARAIMKKAGVPIVPEVSGKDLKASAEKIGLPVLVKAAAGGGGKGMRKVERLKELEEAIQSCKREAKSAFGNDSVFIEKYLETARHVEVQIFGDGRGNVVHLFERDCSLQRRHQKVVEEAPAPGLPQKLRDRLYDAAVKAGQAIGYAGAGTVEFIVDAGAAPSDDTDFYFMEMNTRLQVEHPVTEAITCLDLVEWQIRVARGEDLPLSQNDIQEQGHSFEVRLYAEDPARDYAPQTGKIAAIVQGGCAQYRLDTGITAGDDISPFYDPMLAKLIVHGDNRDQAAAKMRAALRDIDFIGIPTNHGFLARIFENEEFLTGDVTTHFLPSHPDLLADHPPSREALATGLYPLIYAGEHGGDGDSGDDPWRAVKNWRLNSMYSARHEMKDKTGKTTLGVRGQGAHYTVTIEGQAHSIHFKSFENNVLSFDLDGKAQTALVHITDKVIAVNAAGIPHRFEKHDAKEKQGQGAGADIIIAPMPGRITDVFVKNGQVVKAGEAVLRMEAMKIETTLTSGQEGKIASLNVKAGDIVADGDVLARIEGAS